MRWRLWFLALMTATRANKQRYGACHSQMIATATPRVHPPSSLLRPEVWWRTDSERYCSVLVAQQGGGQ